MPTTKVPDFKKSHDSTSYEFVSVNNYGTGFKPYTGLTTTRLKRVIYELTYIGTFRQSLTVISVAVP
jgi:hypothetical protein